MFNITTYYHSQQYNLASCLSSWRHNMQWILGCQCSVPNQYWLIGSRCCVGILDRLSVLLKLGNATIFIHGLIALREPSTENLCPAQLSSRCMHHFIEAFFPFYKTQLWFNYELSMLFIVMKFYLPTDGAMFFATINLTGAYWAPLQSNQFSRYYLFPTVSNNTVWIMTTLLHLSFFV